MAASRGSMRSSKDRFEGMCNKVSVVKKIHLSQEELNMSKNKMKSFKNFRKIWENERIDKVKERDTFEEISSREKIELLQKG